MRIQLPPGATGIEIFVTGPDRALQLSIPVELEAREEPPERFATRNTRLPRRRDEPPPYFWPVVAGILALLAVYLMLTHRGAISPVKRDPFKATMQVPERRAYAVPYIPPLPPQVATPVIRNGSASTDPFGLN